MFIIMRTLCIGLLLLIVQTPALAEYPERTIRLIVPYAAGGTSDILARIIGQKLTAAWKQQVTVENIGGANGNIASDIVAKAEADGYTLLLGTSGSNAVNPSLYTRMPYDAKRDLALVTPVAVTANILVANPKFAANNIKELIDLARSKPGKINFGSSGTGSVLHLSGEMLKTMAGIDIVHVPYKGTGPSLTDLMGGQIDIVFANLPAIVPQVKAGRFKAIAVTTGKRASALPDVPTISEGGVRGYDLSAWFGIRVPAKTPGAITDKINAEVTRIFSDPQTRARLAELGAEPVAMTTIEAKKFFHNEIDKWEGVVKASGAKVD
jgi:tripartite-type tricarboxylate transporter receptor subunit TctC